MSQIYEEGLKIFYKGLEELGIELSEKQIDQFIQYYEMLVEKNKVMNLTAITEFNEVIVKHFIDSLALVKVVDKDDLSNGISIIDIGTGAGFPGIPLKIAFPNINITLLDSLNKRINFLKEVSDELGFEGIDFIHGRSEDFGRNPQFREKFDICVSRAVANLATLSEFCVPFVKVGGSFISYKAGDCGEEVKESMKAVEKMGGKIINQLEYMVPTSDLNRVLLFIEKEKATPKSFPRKAGTPAKEPIK
ncbi:MAG: 16S rRNA (guanine(527)-N(7))-methyltransferase RsmG [Lachnospiraceae bacterium]|nr:16S rRNA (guanine(527)-N(7))-methyltransferase RsmG [Lachnospiraceae bacterium]MEE0863333.1 16S rRNA (guanine(527)-N(7))-methyltransferase RsmG [Lachnospiraceae bacterium]